MRDNWIAALAVLVALALLGGIGGAARAQDSPPPGEPDTEAFINANFHLLRQKMTGFLFLMQMKL